MKPARGIPNRNIQGDLSILPEGIPLDFVEHLHNARRTGKHTDLRLGGPGGMYSWAIPKGLPKEGEKHLAIRTPMHSYSYNNFEGTIGKGYGKGEVKIGDKCKIKLLVNQPNKIQFSVEGTERVFTMIKTKNDNWLIIRPKAKDVLKDSKRYIESKTTMYPPRQLNKLKDDAIDTKGIV